MIYIAQVGQWSDSTVIWPAADKAEAISRVNAANADRDGSFDDFEEAIGYDRKTAFWSDSLPDLWRQRANHYLGIVELTSIERQIIDLFDYDAYKMAEEDEEGDVWTAIDGRLKWSANDLEYTLDDGEPVDCGSLPRAILEASEIIAHAKKEVVHAPL